MNITPFVADLPSFPPDEACVLRLRALYERRGYRRVIPAKFEDYALYLDNKNFLGTEQMLTFMDQSGRLLTLKPDVTLSIARTVPRHPLPVAQKLYYTDEVVRFSPESREYKVLGQVGLEHIGPPDPFSSLEVLDIALRSLALTGEESSMDISHLGFISGLLEDAELPSAVERDILAGLHAKNVHGVSGILEAAGISGDRRERILALARLQGPFSEELERAKALAHGPRMVWALDELSAIAAALRPRAGQSVNLDFSVVNDLNYYNGLIFRGYIRGIPGVVCSGGRYDNLMKRLGKSNSAIGFAVFLHRLNGYYAPCLQQADVIITYPPDSDWSGLLRKVEELTAQGLRVRCEREGADLQSAELSIANIIRYNGSEE